jgi:hypothetical protein
MPKTKANTNENSKILLIDCGTPIKFRRTYNNNNVFVYMDSSETSFFIKNIPHIMDKLISDLPISSHGLSENEYMEISYKNRKVELTLDSFLDEFIIKFRIYIDNNVVSETLYDRSGNFLVSDGEQNNDGFPGPFDQFVNALHEAFDWFMVDEVEEST